MIWHCKRGDHQIITYFFHKIADNIILLAYATKQVLKIYMVNTHKQLMPQTTYKPNNHTFSHYFGRVKHHILNGVDL